MMSVIQNSKEFLKRLKEQREAASKGLTPNELFNWLFLLLNDLIDKDKDLLEKNPTERDIYREGHFDALRTVYEILILLQKDGKNCKYLTSKNE